MKGFVTAILFILFALVFAKAEYVDVATTTSMAICAVEQTDNTSEHSTSGGAILPLDSNKGVGDIEFGDAHTLAHRISASAERMYRFSSIETAQFIKTLLRKMATRMAVLAHCHTRVYDSFRCLGWDNACEHYIFGLRRILI